MIPVVSKIAKFIETESRVEASGAGGGESRDLMFNAEFLFGMMVSSRNE
jgi:hypothetical protein